MDELVGPSSTSTDAAPTVGESTAPLLTFRPDIEGLRALAVGIVVVLHIGVTAVSGGYVGVDVFFVISGYLITSLLIDEVRGTKRISILGFYARRARRILPAACFVIAATVVAAYLELGPLVGRTTAIDGQWAAGFAANFRLIRVGTDYFASALPPSPLQHFWSLAVEEQFYLVWPTVLFALVVVGRRLGRSALVLRLGLVAIVTASLYWSVHLTRIDPTTAYFSPFTRAWELSAGALIAVFTVSIAKVPAPMRAAATWIGLVMVAIAAFTFGATTEFPGFAALLPVVGSMLLVAGGIGQPAGSAGVVLAIAPMRWLGKISFSVYLWHWPVIIIAEERSTTPLSNVARAACAVIILALSVLSYYVIEHPIRSSQWLRPRNAHTSWQRSRNALALGLAAIVFAVAVSAYTNNRAAFAINSSNNADRTDIGSSLVVEPSASTTAQMTSLQRQVRTLVQQGLALRRVPADVDPPVLKIAAGFDRKYFNCLQRSEDTTVKSCVFGSVASRRTIIVFGDSHAMTWMPAIDAFGKQAGYRVVSVQKEACVVPSVPVYVVATRVLYKQCTTWRANALRYIRSAKPAAVVFSFTEAITTAQGRSDLDVWLTGLRTSVQAMAAPGTRIIQIGNNAHLAQDPGLCLSRPNANPVTCTGPFTNRDRDDSERELVRSLGATYIDVEPWFCLGGQCPVIIDHRIAYADQGHISSQYVADLAPLVAVALRSAGLR